MPALESAVRLLDRIRDAVCVLLLASIAILIGLQVVHRYILNDPLSWPEEIARNAFVWTVALGTAKLFRERTAYTIDAFIVATPPSVQRAARMALQGLAILVFAALVAGSFEVLAANSHIRTAIGVPINLLYASFPVASVLAVIAILTSLAEERRSPPL